MLEHFILIVMLQSGAGDSRTASMTTTEFASKTRCEASAVVIEQRANAFYRGKVEAFCVPMGIDNPPPKPVQQPLPAEKVK